MFHNCSECGGTCPEGMDRCQTCKGAAKPLDEPDVNWWLAEKSRYGYANELVDGPHSEREGVEQALFLIRSLGLQRGREFVCVRVEQTEVEPVAHDVDHEALANCKHMIDSNTRGGGRLAEE